MAHEAIRKAMKGFGTNEKALIENICDKTFEELQEIGNQFEDEYGRNMIDDIKSECSGNFEKVLVGLCYPREEYDAKLLHKAFDGMGTNEKLMIEVLCYRTKDELKEIQEAYDEMYDTDLVTRIENECSGNLEKLMLKCLDDPDDKDPEDEKQVLDDVEKLYNAGQGKFGTDEGVFIRILGGSSREYREALYWSYAENTKKGTSLVKAIKSEFSGNVERALVALVTPTYVYYTEEIRDSIKGMGTNDSKLIRCIITQKERHLQKIAEHYLGEYGQSLESDIKGDTSGDYERALIAIMDNWAPLGE